MLTHHAQRLALAARNIAQMSEHVGYATLIICSPEKHPLAQAVARELEARQIECHLLRLGHKIDLANTPLRTLAQHMAEGGMLVLLLQPEHAPFLFDVAGRPDHGLKVPPGRLFCDWLIRPASLLRTYAIDLQELQGFRQALLSALDGARQMRIVS